MIGMYQFGCADAGAELSAAACEAGAEVAAGACEAGAEAGAAELLHAPTSTAATATLSNCLYVIWFPTSCLVDCLSRPLSGLPQGPKLGGVLSRLASPATDDVEIDGEDHDHAGRDDLPLLRHVYELETVGERLDDERANDGAEDRAHATGERRAADDDRGDRVELVAVTEGRLGRADAGGQQDATEAGEQAAQRVNGGLPFDDGDAGKAGRFFVATERVRIATQRRLREDQACQECGSQHDDGDVRDWENRENHPDRAAHDQPVKLVGREVD